MPHKIQKLSMRAIVSSMASVEDLPPFVYLADGLRREGIQCHFAVPSNLIAYVKDKGFPVTQLGPDELGDAYLRAEPDLHKGLLDSPAVQQYSQALQAAGPDAFVALADLCAHAHFLIGSITMPLGLIVHELAGARYIAVQTHNPAELIETPEELAEFRRQLGLKPCRELGPMGISPSYGLSSELNLVATSPAVLGVMFDRPLNWPASCQAIGFFYAPDDESYEPDDTVRQFVDDAPVVVAFGTRRRAERDALIALHASAAKQAGRRLVCRNAWSAEWRQEVSPDILLVGNLVPEHWLFERAACVIHDSDGGVTASALRSGVPSIPVPSDPSLLGWAMASYNLGCSPQIIKYADLNPAVLTDAIRLAVSDASIISRSASLRQRMLAERGVDRAVALISSLIATDAARGAGDAEVAS